MGLRPRSGRKPINIALYEYILDAFLIGKSDAVLAASIFHFGELKINDVKKFLNSNKVSVRL